jgi:acyl carrier protein
VTDHTPDVFTVRQWLIQHLAEALNVEQDDIDPEAPFAAYGLDSVAAVSLSGDLEDWLGRPLPATLAWDYPSIDALASYLGQPTESILARPVD